MEKAEKKRLRNQYRQEQRLAAFDALPLPLDQLNAMFDMLDLMLREKGCDHTRRFTQTWLTERRHNLVAVFGWLDTVNGYCDCQVRTNVKQHVEEAAKAGA